MFQFLQSLFEPEIHDIGFVITAPALLFFSVKSGQKRKRLDASIFFVTMLIPITLINASFLYLQTYLEWKEYDDGTAAIIAGSQFTSEDMGEYISYENNDSTQYGWKKIHRYKLRSPTVSIAEALFVASVMCLIGLGVRRLTIWKMGTRLLDGHCYHCGYNLTGTNSDICPECGNRSAQLLKVPK